MTREYDLKVRIQKGPNGTTATLLEGGPVFLVVYDEDDRFGVEIDIPETEKIQPPQGGPSD